MAIRKTPRISGTTSGSTRSGAGIVQPVSGSGRTSSTVHASSSSATADPKLRQTIDSLLGENDAYSHLLGVLGSNGSGVDNELLQQLLLLAGGNLGKSGTAYGDIQKLLVEMALKNLTSQEQRNYDKSVLDEQRLYDNPQNQLARLMGSGISRDAAIQMLQGGQDPALVGSGAESALPSELPNPTDKLMQGLQVGASLLSTVGSLVSLGFSIPQAIQQTHLLRNQGILSDRQLSAYNSASKAFHILNAAGAATKTFGSATAAAAAIRKLADSGNTDASAFVADPNGLQQLVDNAPFSSPVLANMYQSEHSSDLFRKQMRQQDLTNSLTNAKVEEVYQGIRESVARIRKINADADKVYQDLQRGAIEIEIAGQTLVIAENTAKQFALEGAALDVALSMTDQNGRDLPHLMGMNQFIEMWEQFQESAVNYDDGENFIAFLKNNRDAAFTTAYCAYLATQDFQETLDDENDSPSIWSNIMRFWNMIHNAGISAEVGESGKGLANSAKIGLELIKLFIKK